MIEKKINSNEAGQRFDKFLKKFMPNATTSFFYKMLRKKNITLNDKKAEGNEILAINDSIKFFFSNETFGMFRGDLKDNSIDIKIYEKALRQLNIDVIFENDHILVANKPTGVLSQKSGPNDISLNEWLIGYLLDSKQISTTTLETFKPSICNRLDRNTSGLIICSKSLPGSQKMAEIIKNRSLKKYYLALAKGKTPAKKHLIGFVIKDDKINKVTVLHDNIKGSQKIETAFSTLYYDPKHNESLIEVDLITGKTHQIRAHMSSIGFPLVGDIKYGDNKEKGNGQMLHAYKIVFPKISEDKFNDLSGKTILSYPEWDIIRNKI